MKQIKQVFVAGAGAMGSGIAQTAAMKGYSVILYDLENLNVETGINTIKGSLQRFVRSKKFTEEQKNRVLEDIRPSTSLHDAVDADFAIEAVFENLAVKQELFGNLDGICRPETIFGTNTSSLPISAIATGTNRRDKVIGTHFMNPVPLMKGVEIIPGVETSDDTLQTTLEFITSLDKEPNVAKDYAGFVASRILDVMLNEAVKCVMDGNKPEDIDAIVKTCLNFPMGPCELIDLAGADILLHVMETMKEEFGDRYHAAPLLKQMVRSKNLGRKTGKGFYNYQS
ncbi:MAG: 3-hydroxyacyl-CoA dehydrogenase family protein [Deltaproteobacteria bacterium]|jgi:3-hydroxybutyryl-CoA dehydrogenase|nr:3-hydroxyacyl-CoA dehydrogenase family protein [Deltaproteobacteria bacterium]MBT4642538.1 3-hydroxyacyl-CoA dehydrogenase family protein [Deltaproteobacteria bacterium]MBT7155798.1 3-hydroxyacyl-CoA dehydrogenase family protein [Deltaproteobacteria bacterium]